MSRGIEPGEAGALHALVARLFPIDRSLTGPGVRATLAVLAERIPLALHEVPSGTAAFDWTVPDEWTLRRATLTGPDGRLVADSARRNLEVVGYSAPIRTRLSLAELEPHLHSLPDRPDWIPYRTSYYQRTWGFCLPHRVRESLADGEYEVAIDADLAPGALTYGELFLPGERDEEILVSAHCCHPSLANDNLSGLAVVSRLAERLTARRRRRFGYRFLFAPGTIGMIVWLSRNREAAARTRAALVAANLGDLGAFHYKRSFAGDAWVDRAVATAFRDLGRELVESPFVPFGYDERQLSSPGFRIPAGSLTRTPWGRYPEYHTSADDLDLVRPEALADSLAAYERVIDVLEGDVAYRSLQPHGEPMLGRRGLYRPTGGDEGGRERELARLWVLHGADGRSSLGEISARSGLRFSDLRAAADELAGVDLIVPVDSREDRP